LQGQNTPTPPLRSAATPDKEKKKTPWGGGGPKMAEQLTRVAAKAQMSLTLAGRHLYNARSTAPASALF